MNKKPKLKVQHKVEELITMIETNNMECLKKMVECNRFLLKRIKMDDNEPIYYAIKYKNNKIFKYILDNSIDINYDYQKLFMTIIKTGTCKMLRNFFLYAKFEVDLLNKYWPNLILDEKNLGNIGVLLNETNLCYSFKISENAYKLLGYNFNTNILNNGAINVVINKDEKVDISNVLDLEKKFKDHDEKFNVIFIKYKKIFLVMGKSMKPPKNLAFKHFQELIKYI